MEGRPRREAPRADRRQAFILPVSATVPAGPIRSGAGAVFFMALPADRRRIEHADGMHVARRLDPVAVRGTTR